MYGEQAARDAMHKSVVKLTSDRIRDIEQVVVAGKPAEALLKVAGQNPATLIVVGNRGLGATEGEVLGSVPREIVRTADLRRDHHPDLGGRRKRRVPPPAPRLVLGGRSALTVLARTDDRDDGPSGP